MQIAKKAFIVWIVLGYWDWSIAVTPITDNAMHMVHDESPSVVTKEAKLYRLFKVRNWPVADFKTLGAFLISNGFFDPKGH